MFRVFFAIAIATTLIASFDIRPLIAEDQSDFLLFEHENYEAVVAVFERTGRIGRNSCALFIASFVGDTDGLEDQLTEANYQRLATAGQFVEAIRSRQSARFFVSELSYVDALAQELSLYPRQYSFLEEYFWRSRECWADFRDTDRGSLEHDFLWQSLENTDGMTIVVRQDGNSAPAIILIDRDAETVFRLY